MRYLFFLALLFVILLLACSKPRLNKPCVIGQTTTDDKGNFYVCVGTGNSWKAGHKSKGAPYSHISWQHSVQTKFMDKRKIKINWSCGEPGCEHHYWFSAWIHCTILNLLSA